MNLASPTDSVLTFDQLSPDDVILLQEHVPAPNELHFILVALVVEPIETGMPQTWNMYKT